MYDDFNIEETIQIRRNWRQKKIFVKSFDIHYHKIVNCDVIGDILVTASNDSSVKMINMRDNSMIHHFTGHMDIVTSVKIFNKEEADIIINNCNFVCHNNNMIVISSSLDCYIRIWNTSMDYVSCYTFSPIIDFAFDLDIYNNPYIIAASCDGKIMLIGIEGGEMKQVAENHSKIKISGFQYNRHKHLLVVSGEDTISLLNLNYQSHLNIDNFSQIQFVQILAPIVIGDISLIKSTSHESPVIDKESVQMKPTDSVRDEIENSMHGLRLWITGLFEDGDLDGEEGGDLDGDLAKNAEGYANGGGDGGKRNKLIQSNHIAVYDNVQGEFRAIMNCNTEHYTHLISNSIRGFIFSCFIHKKTHVFSINVFHEPSTSYICTFYSCKSFYFTKMRAYYNESNGNFNLLLCGDTISLFQISSRDVKITDNMQRVTMRCLPEMMNVNM